MALTKATYSIISGAVINILDYGASPSATGATNRVAIQAAIDAAIASTSTRAVYIPRGAFEIDAGIVLASPIRIFGDGFDISNETGSVIRTTQTTGVALEFNNASGSFDDGFILENFIQKKNNPIKTIILVRLVILVRTLMYGYFTMDAHGRSL